jgi:DNA-directed RNA polymerase specialized sigma24 family protein
MATNNLAEKSDEDLMELYKLGNTIAFDILFQHNSGPVLGYLKRRISKDKQAQDILQDIFLKLHRSKHQYDRTWQLSQVFGYWGPLLALLQPSREAT